VSLIVRLARQNSSWGYDRIVGAQPIWATRSQIKPSATFFAGTASPLLPSVAKPLHGGTSSPHIWR
jgi:hypothetical protein